MIATSQSRYVGRRVRWCHGDLVLPESACLPGTPLTYEAILVGPGVWEITNGVTITSGDEGSVTSFVGADNRGDVYEILFDCGGVFVMALPQPHAVEILSSRVGESGAASEGS